jgi:hypothetical protein
MKFFGPDELQMILENSESFESKDTLRLVCKFFAKNCPPTAVLLEDGREAEQCQCICLSKAYPLIVIVTSRVGLVAAKWFLQSTTSILIVKGLNIGDIDLFDGLPLWPKLNELVFKKCNGFTGECMDFAKTCISVTKLSFFSCEVQGLDCIVKKLPLLQELKIVGSKGHFYTSLDVLQELRSITFKHMKWPVSLPIFQLPELVQFTIVGVHLDEVRIMPESLQYLLVEDVKWKKRSGESDECAVMRNLLPSLLNLETLKISLRNLETLKIYDCDIRFLPELPASITYVQCGPSQLQEFPAAMTAYNTPPLYVHHLILARHLRVTGR